MVTLEATKRKYHGKFAAGYRKKRMPQQRWQLENEIVGYMLRECNPRTVLDVPCGEGRFYKLYKALKLERALGIDASDDMLRLAEQEGWKDLENGNATDLRYPNASFDTVVCVRFLDLIPEDAMRRVLQELLRVARSTVILTIRLGEAYTPKVNTATHSISSFRDFVRRRGWRIAEDAHDGFRLGWRVMMLKRRIK